MVGFYLSICGHRMVMKVSQQFLSAWNNFAFIYCINFWNDFFPCKTAVLNWLKTPKYFITGLQSATKKYIFDTFTKKGTHIWRRKTTSILVNRWHTLFTPPTSHYIKIRVTSNIVPERFEIVHPYTGKLSSVWALPCLFVFPV